MKVLWTPEALQDRLIIWEYISSENPQAAIKIDVLFSQAAKTLEKHPMLGQRGKVSGTRDFIVHKNYRLVYQLKEDTIWLLALVHTARQWPAP